MNIVQKSLLYGGKISPLVIEDGYYRHIGFMNPSIFIDSDGDILVNLRHINYTLYHSENTQKFLNFFGPLAYLHPENDLALRTINYLCRLDKDLNMINHTMVDTSKCDIEPVWEFTGQEDCRVVEWEGQLYLVGVRRDTKPNGEGRMEYSHISLDKENWRAIEVDRQRIPAPGNDDSYCEKNWMPILDKPYHFVKWTSPVEVVKAIPGNPVVCTTEILHDAPFMGADQRGGSQVVKWGNMYICITHDVNLFKNYLGQKDGIYRHRLLVWDDAFNLVGVSNQFSFLDARIEFCAGAAVYEGDLLISFGFQDNAAYILRTPGAIIEDLIIEAMKNVE